jgi:hypothetical protein
VYTYLTQIIAVFLPLMILYLYIKHRRQEAMNLAIACALAFVASIPFMAYTGLQIHSPYFWESMQRVGLVYTHLPASNIFTAGFWVVAALGLWFLSWRWISALRGDITYAKLVPLYAISGIAMLVASASNVLTGKESENSQHIERFMVVWLVAALTIFIAYAWRYRQYIKSLALFKKIVLGVLLLVVTFGVWLYLRKDFTVTTMVKDNQRVAVERQSYAAPLRWLDEHSFEPAVIWTIGAEEVNNYIPILTKHYVLFAPSAGDYLLPGAEQMRRYLVSHYFDNLTLSDIEADFWSYAGVAHAVHQYKTYNRKVRACRLLFLDKIGYNCGEFTNSISFQGEALFQELYRQYTEDIRPQMSEELQKSHVAYLLVDDSLYPSFQDIAAIPGVTTTREYQDARFSVYSLEYNF